VNRLARAVVAAGALVSLLLVGQHAAGTPAMDKVALNYFYAGAHLYGMTETTVSGVVVPQNEAISGSDFHSLGEVAVESTDEKQIVEVGWSVDPTTYGDSNPHIMVYHWVNDHETCYTTATNLCGFTLYAGRTHAPGDNISTLVGTEQTISISHFNSAWWIAFGAAGEWMGKFPDTVWSGATPPVTTFTTFNTFRAFGEVAANSTTPCTNMGDGALKTTATGSKLSNFAFTNTPTFLLTLDTATAPTKYNAVLSSTSHSVYYGGPGFC